jgi:hypothetical protein
MPGLGGAWRSLVAHLLWEQGVGGSNPLAPTVKPARPIRVPCGCSSTVEPQPSKLVMGVRFPSPALAPLVARQSAGGCARPDHAGDRPTPRGKADVRSHSDGGVDRRLGRRLRGNPETPEGRRRRQGRGRVGCAPPSTSVKVVLSLNPEARRDVLVRTATPEA